MSRAAPTASPRPLPAARAVFLASFLLLWGLSAREAPTGDAATMVGVARNVVVDGRLAFDHRSLGYTVEGTDGLQYGKFPLPWSLVLVPEQSLERLLSTSALPPGDKELYLRLVRGVTPAATGAISIVLLFLALVRLGRPRGTALGLSLAWHLATAALPYLNSHYSEVFQAAAINGALLALAAFDADPRPRRAVLLGLALGLVAASKVSLAPLALVFGAAALLRALVAGGALRLSAWAALGAAAPLALAAGYSQWRFGTPFSADYGWFPIPPRIEYPTPERLFGLLLSPGRGLLWFSPLVVLAAVGAVTAPRRGDRAATACTWGVLATILVYASFTVWHGSEQWGPRFLVPLAGPLAVLSAGPVADAWRRRATGLRLAIAALVAAGLAVNLGGLLVSYNDFFAAVPYRPYSDLRLDAADRPTGPVEWDNLWRTNFVPAFSPIRGHWWLAGHAALGGDPAADAPWRDRVVDGPVIRTAGLQPRFNLWFDADEGWNGETRRTALLLGIVLALATAGAAWEALRRPRAR